METGVSTRNDIVTRLRSCRERDVPINRKKKNNFHHSIYQISWELFAAIDESISCLTFIISEAYFSVYVIPRRIYFQEF